MKEAAAAVLQNQSRIQESDDEYATSARCAQGQGASFWIFAAAHGVVTISAESGAAFNWPH
jgi:hypothetical protein